MSDERFRLTGDGCVQHAYPHFTSACQRLVVLTFSSPTEAEAWDLAGRPFPPCESHSTLEPRSAP